MSAFVCWLPNVAKVADPGPAGEKAAAGATSAASPTTIISCRLVLAAATVFEAVDESVIIKTQRWTLFRALRGHFPE